MLLSTPHSVIHNLAAALPFRSISREPGTEFRHRPDESETRFFMFGKMRRAIAAVRSWLPAGDAGMSTAEYAVGTVAAVAFAVVLYKVVNSSAVMSALSKIIKDALSVHL
jgi:uncharacterized protein DUF4244